MDDNTNNPNLPLGGNPCGDDWAKLYCGTTQRQFRGMVPGGTMSYYYDYDKVHKLGAYAKPGKAVVQ